MNSKSHQTLALVLLCRLSRICSGTDAFWEPFRELHGFCSDCNPAIPESPDPLVAYTWPNSTESSFVDPQLFRVTTDQFEFTPSACGTYNKITSSASMIVITSVPCSIRCDWNVEQAGWMEVLVAGNQPSNMTLIGSLSEFNVPYPGKTRRMTYYPSAHAAAKNDTYRLETNPELYEGIRYTWLDVPATTDDSLLPLELSAITLVTKIKPLAYVGSYRSHPASLTRTWYTATYSVRLNTERERFNSVLVERGDRVAIQGDGHPTIATALVAFRLNDLILNVVRNETDSAGNRSVVDDTIMAYPLYWCESVLQWWRATGDRAVAIGLLEDVRWIVDQRIADFMDPNLDLVWMGWDDRLGNGWCGHATGDDCGLEAHQSFAALVIRLCQDVCRALHDVGMDADADYYCRTAENFDARFRSAFVSGSQGMRLHGVHSAANAINAGLIRENEMTKLVSDVLNNPASICSESPFNQFWILQALGNIPDMERALASVQLCWTPMFKLTTGCFWENFVPDWTEFLEQGSVAPGLQSACHPWASGVAAWQTHVHAGLEALSPGYDRVIVAPYVSTTYPHVAASVPTPWGTVSVNATWDETQARILIHKVSLRPGFVALYHHIGQGTCESLLEVRLDGKRVKAHAFDSKELQTKDAVASAALQQHFTPSRARALRFVLTSGDAVVEASYQSCRARNFSQRTESKSPRTLGTLERPMSGQIVPPFGPATYPATSSIDRSSQGDGLRRYGKDGYILLGFDNITDRVFLPNYVTSSAIWRHGYPGGWSLLREREFLGTSDDLAAFLPDLNASNSTTRRALGTVGYVGPAGGQYHNVNINVELAKPHPFCASLYFFGKSPSDKHIVRSMDLVTKMVIAPSSFIHDYSSGVWWTLCYDKSIRIRLQDMVGVHLSAIAFRGSNLLSARNISVSN